MGLHSTGQRNSFIEWEKVQSDRGDGVAPYQFDSAMHDNGFEQEKDDSNWFIYRGLNLKGIEIED